MFDDIVRVNQHIVRMEKANFTKEIPFFASRYLQELLPV